MKKVVLAGMIGNGLEWYDYALYGQMAVLLSKLFFPEGDATAHLLATYGIFAVGFLMRPLGAVFFGWMGDKYGRRRAMVVAVLMMAVPTGCIGLLPSYESIGIAAPILLTLIRLMQGLSLGGEFSGSITYIVEHAPAHRRGVAGAASLVSLNLGFLLGLLVTQGCTWLFGQAAFDEWAWRIPFLLGIAIGFVGFYIRTQCSESPAYEQARDAGHLSQAPVTDALRHHWREMLQAFCMYLTVTMPFYLTAIYFIGFTQKHLGFSMEQAVRLNALNMLAMMLMYMPAAWASDRFGRKKVLLAGLFLIAALIYPVFALLVPGQILFIVGLVQFGFCFILGIYLSPIPAVLVEMFPTSVRYTGMAIAYNIAAAVFGGTAPFVCEWLIRETGRVDSIAFYVLFCNAVSLAALWFYKDRFKEAL